ncbi:hypothetical protein HDV00_010124 [Rhizophlyctis rosea]|nr:hypothetical protein HDV00_010124 [Rhizophlyctis rosea]
MPFPPKTTQPTVTRIDFAATPLPEYDGHYAIVIDYLFTSHECADLLSRAEASGEWEQAQINIGGGKQQTMADYRNSERIMWDSPETAEWILERVRPFMGNVEEWTVESAKKGTSEWVVTRLNERLRFLKYGAGQYFKKHCDGAYTTPDNSETSFITLHMYLNGPAAPHPPTFPSYNSLQKPTLPSSLARTASSILPTFQQPQQEQTIEGGATRFWGLGVNHRSWVDVEPRVGRVLLFQHKGLIHSGEDVVSGVKITMRTDVMYQRKKDSKS